MLRTKAVPHLSTEGGGVGTVLCRDRALCLGLDGSFRGLGCEVCGSRHGGLEKAVTGVRPQAAVGLEV